MIQAASGLASGKDPVKCAEKAASAAMDSLAALGSRKADAVMVFTSGETTASFVPMLHAIRNLCGTGSLTGCSGAGVLTQEGEIEGENAVAVLAVVSDTMKATPFFIRDLKGRDEEVGREIGRLTRPLLSDNALLIIFPDTLSCNPDQLFGGLYETAGPVPVVGGGAAAGVSAGSKTHQFCGGEAMTNAVSGVVLTGAIVSSVGVTQSCLPVGKLRRVTRSEGNAIRTLDGIPAVRALVECLAGPGRQVSEDLHRLAPHLFVAFPSGAGREMKRGQYLVRNILGVDPEDGSVFVGRGINEGELISFALRDPDGARDDLKAMIEESLPLAGKPDVGLYFNCCARGQGLYGLPDIDTSFIRNTFTDMPLAGFFGYAEIASQRGRARMHNYSGVMVLVSEAPSC